MSLNFHTAVIAASRRAVTPPGDFDAAAQDWFDRIVAAGSTISEANKTAASALFATLRSNGYLAGPLVELGLFAGPDSLDGAVVKAWDASAIGNLTTVIEANIVHSRLTGINTTATTSRLESDLNLNYAGFGQDDFSMGLYTPDDLLNSADRYLAIGGNNNTDILGGSGMRGRMRSATLTSASGIMTGNGPGFYAWRRSGATAVNYEGPIGTGTDTTSSAAISAGTTKIFSDFGGANGLANRKISAYFFGNAGIDLAILRAAINTYIAALT